MKMKISMIRLLKSWHITAYKMEKNQVKQNKIDKSSTYVIEENRID